MTIVFIGSGLGQQTETPLEGLSIITANYLYQRTTGERDNQIIAGVMNTA